MNFRKESLMHEEWQPRNIHVEPLRDHVSIYLPDLNFKPASRLLDLTSGIDWTMM